MKYLHVRENEALVRDTTNKAKLNIDTKSLDKYKDDRNRLLTLNSVTNETKKLKNDVEEIKTSIDCIKKMLEVLLEKQNKCQ